MHKYAFRLRYPRAPEAITVRVMAPTEDAARTKLRRMYPLLCSTGEFELVRDDRRGPEVKLA